LVETAAVFGHRSPLTSRRHDISRWL
jgi:hypothetical protein